MSLGIVIGKFLPYHRGHGALVAAAQEGCDDVAVIVCDSPHYEITLERRRNKSALARRAVVGRDGHRASERFELVERRQVEIRASSEVDADVGTFLDEITGEHEKRWRADSSRHD